MPSSVRYHFRQLFNVSAQEAYEWCTNYKSGQEDHMLMGEKTAARQVKRVADSTIILTDTFRTEQSAIKKQKLVELYPDSLSWNATHLTGPAKYSQFTYEITADGKNASHIDFTGLFIDYKNESLSKAEAEKLAQQLCKEDSETWALLAREMANDFCR